MFSVRCRRIRNLKNHSAAALPCRSRNLFRRRRSLECFRGWRAEKAEPLLAPTEQLVMIFGGQGNLAQNWRAGQFGPRLASRSIWPQNGEPVRWGGDSLKSLLIENTLNSRFRHHDPHPSGHFGQRPNVYSQYVNYSGRSISYG